MKTRKRHARLSCLLVLGAAPVLVAVMAAPCASTNLDNDAVGLRNLHSTHETEGRGTATKEQELRETGKKTQQQLPRDFVNLRDDVSIGMNAVLCVAFVDRLFVRVPSYDSDTDDSTEWLEHTSSADHHFRFIQKIVLEDASVIQLADPDRGVRLFFDARDPDAVKAYWCAGADHCVWSALASHGELRYGHGADCASFIPGLMPLQTHIDASPVVKNTRLCLAFFDKIFVRMPNNSKEGENYTRWIEHGLDMQEIPFTQSSIRDDAGLIRLTDPGRRMRVLFDARDPDAVLGYVCQAHKRTTDHCVWGMFVSEGELRYGPDADCENFREPDLEREQTRMKVVKPELHVNPQKLRGGYHTLHQSRGSPLPLRTTASKNNAAIALNTFKHADSRTWGLRFKLAASALGVPPPFNVEAATERDWARLRAWSRGRYEFFNPRGGAPRTATGVVHGRKLEYTKVFKAANNNIRASIDTLTEGELRDNFGESAVKAAAEARAGAKKPKLGPPDCRFTFLRDPLKRFISGYAEFEHTAFQRRSHPRCVTEDWALRFLVNFTAATTAIANKGADITVPRMGTKDRARLALRLIISLLWVNDQGHVHGPDDPNEWPVKQEFSCFNYEFQHMFPQASNFNLPHDRMPGNGHGSSSEGDSIIAPLDFVGKLESFERDWRDLAGTCGVEPASAMIYRGMPDGGGHAVTSNDKDGTKAAMHALLAEDQDVAAAFCLLFLDDYTIGEYQLPPMCQDDPRVVAGALTRQSKHMQ